MCNSGPCRIRRNMKAREISRWSPAGAADNGPACLRRRTKWRGRQAFERWVGRQKVASPEGTVEVQSHTPSFSRPFGTCGAHLDTTSAGPRTVPVRSGLSGVKTLELSRIPRPSDVLRAGTARAPVVVSRCAPVYLPDGDYQIVDVMLVTHLEVSARNGARKPRK